MNHTVSLDEFNQEFSKLDQRPDIVLELSPVSAWCLMAQIQLACRHPTNDGLSRDIAESIARDLQLVLATTPALATVAEQGWDASYDEEMDNDGRTNMSNQNSEFFTLSDAVAVLGRTVRVATDRLPNNLPVGTQGSVDGLLRKSAGYLVGITWDNFGGKKGNGLTNWFTRLEYDAWLEEIPQQEEIND